MAETKTLKTRIKLLYKSYAEWESIKNTFVPLMGEVCFCEIPATTGAVANEPCLLFKVGNGVDTFADLAYGHALSADNFEWSKRQHLEWSDMTEEFKQGIIDLIGGTASDTLYQIVADGANKWKLQKSEDKGETWVDATGVIDVSGLDSKIDEEIARAKAEEAKKVDKEITSADGKALIFNEKSGGGAKFENVNGVESFVGVNDGSNGLYAQIYADKMVEGKWTGVKIDIGESGAYYTVGNKSAAERMVEDNEIATKKDISALHIAEYSLTKEADPGDYAAIYHLTKDGVAVGEAINIAKDQLLKSVEIKTCATKDVPIEGLNPGDKYMDFTFIVEKGAEAHTYIAIKDMVKPYTAGNGIVITSENAIEVDTDVIASVEYVDAAVDAGKEYIDGKIADEVAAREEAIEGVKFDLDDEIIRAQAAEEALDERLAKLETVREPEVMNIGGKDYFFANGVTVRIEDNATDNIAYYCVADNTQKSIRFPYGSMVHGGGYGESASKAANFESSTIIMQSGKVKSLIGGSRNFGNVGVATIIINGGQATEGIVGGGAAPNTGMINNVGLANITANGGNCLTIYGGGQGLSVVGKTNVLINGGTHQWVTVGGSNGTTGSGNMVVTGGNITCLQAVNRGSIQDATITIAGGNIANVYGGGETGDSSVNGKCEKTIFHIESGFNGNLNKGTYGGVEDASHVSGDYIQGTISAEQAALCNLVLRTYPGLKQIAYTGNVNDLIQNESDVLILDCNF